MNFEARTSRLFTIITLALAFCALALTPALGQGKWTAPPDANGYKNPKQANSASVTAGKKVYDKYCFLCHGEKGDGNGPSAATSAVKPADFTNKALMKGQTDGALAWKILSGRGPMPAWGPVLQEDQIWNVINYIRTFSK